MSLGIVVEHLLGGWHQLHSDDELHLIVGSDAELSVPPSVTVHRVKFGRQHFISRVRAQSVDVPRLCRQVHADILLGVLPTTSINRLPCPRVILTYDLRYELRPEQFPKWSRRAKRFSYDIGFRQADAIVCISERTRQDLLRTHPRLRSRMVRVAHLGADHVDGWSVHRPDEGYAIAFGQYGNKNVHLVIDAWSILLRRGTTLPLVFTGLSEAERLSVESRIHGLGLSHCVTALPWLPDDVFRERFASAELVVFPSDFEGFGLPAAEAMRLGIPLVISPEPALTEITAGHATVMGGSTSEALADAVTSARHATPHELALAKTHAQRFTWERTARHIRDALTATVNARSKST